MLTPQQILKLALEAEVDPRTVRRWQAGNNMKITVRERLEAAAKRLRIRRPDAATQRAEG